MTLYKSVISIRALYTRYESALCNVFLLALSLAINKLKIM